MTTFELYLLLTLPRIGTAFLTITMISMVCLAAVVIVSACCASDVLDKEDPSYASHVARAWKGVWWVVGLMPLFVVFAFIPTEKVVLMLIGWELMSSVEGLGELPADIVEYLRGLLQDYTAPGDSA